MKNVENWEDFRGRLEPLSKKEKGDAFESLVQAYLRIEPTYASQLTHVWLLDEVPERIRQKLNLPLSDQGIDLIAETKAGEFWAIQCKYKQDETQSVTWREIATFAGLAFGICEHIAFGLLCTSGERYTKVLKDQNNIGICSSEVWHSLDAAFFSAVRALSEHKTTRPVPFSPRPHQINAINRARKYYANKDNQRGKLIMPCGSGKSLTSFWLAEALKAQRIVVAVPSLALMRQTLHVWLRELVATDNAENVKWLCVCSDESVGDLDRDDVGVYTQDLGIPCVTDQQTVQAGLRSVAGHERLIVFTTYQSGEVTAAASKALGMAFDLGIMDEAHKTVGSRDKRFAHLLLNENIAIEKRVFMTATERRYAGSRDKIISMDDAVIYGDTFELLSFKEALEVKPPILSDYRIVTVFITRSEVAEIVAANRFVKPSSGRWSDELEATMFTALITLRKAMRKYDIKHAISFHSTIARARAFRDNQDIFTESYPEYGALETFHVAGSMPTSVRDRSLRHFASAQRSLITNARCLTEGVDVPAVDAVLFADPKRSTIDIVQAVGRALRPVQGKERGYVIVPVIVDDASTEQEIIESSEFKQVMTVLGSLATNDERIIEYFKAIAEGRKPSSGTLVDIETSAKLAAKINDAVFIEAVQLRTWSRLAKLSWRPFEEARAFVRGLGLKNLAEWNAYVKGERPDRPPKPEDIPSNSNRVYKDAWVSWGDWFGTGNRKNIDWRPFEEARAFVRGLELKSKTEWSTYAKGELPHLALKPEDIPSNPRGVYKDAWVSWGDWFGTGNRKGGWRPFEEARAFVQGLGLQNQTEWQAYAKGERPDRPPKPEDIPRNPRGVYKDTWVSIGDWLGTGNRKNIDWRPFEEARAFVRGLGLKNLAEWQAYAKGKRPDRPPKPEDIPRDPYSAYKDKDAWVSIGDWLGTGRIASQYMQYRPFEEARAFVQGLGLENTAEWRAYAKGELPDRPPKPENIPSDPYRSYKDTWVSWGDWLGTGNRKGGWRPFEEARAFVRALGLKNRTEWQAYVKGERPDRPPKPEDIPRDPYSAYKDKDAWVSIGDWLGKKKD